ncbi:oleandomycin transport system permease protein [Kribbella orskensis]|uniref:Transport permease protein n=1 Tax=Kribbella orskensis TaxID=2512216 RepID=A0ABY2BR67_9ACTN|nr:MULTISPECIES: ABC transporter permease [Kribbella]TCN37178.1 oleandomycin transport system permease protein [Kribbella sp. VKM Ac-2500]TCO27914.1 oleandomycin transport system permease protein [Kribbella orskensis]
MSTATLEAAPAHAPRRSRPFAWAQQSLTLAWRNIVRIRQNPEALADVTFQPIIFLVLFLFVFGGAVANGGTWHDYLPYLLPGLLVQTVVFSTMGTGVALNDDFAKGVFDRFRSLPISRIAPLVGAVLGDAVRYTLSIVILMGTGFALGFRFGNGVGNGLLACLIVLAFALSLCWIWVWLGLKLKTAQGVQGIAFLVMFPLTFGSNVFVQTDTLPGFLQAFVNVNPVKYLVDTMRGLMLGGDVQKPLLITLPWMVGLVAVFAPLAIRAYRQRT